MRAEFALPWPPVQSNRLYRVGRGRIHIQPVANDYKVGSGLVVKSQALIQTVKVVVGKPLKLTVYQYPPRGWHGDTDNGLKLVIDALALGLGINDYWITELHTYRGAPTDKPHVDLLLEYVEWTTLDEVRE